MGGKTKQSQRTKNNARPSSSGRSAELLGNAVNLDPSMILGGGKMSSLFPTLTTPIIDQGLTQEFSICIKKLNKKDPITKVKALNEMSELVANSKVDDVVTALPSWAHFYRILSIDTDCKVREATQACHAAVAARCGRRLAPVLKALVAAWLQAQYDDHAPAATLADRSLKSTFPENKLPEVIAFCQTEVVTYITDNIIGNNDKAFTKRVEDSDERRLQQQAARGGALRVLQSVAEQCAAARGPALWAALRPVLTAPAFWQPQPLPTRAAWFAAMSAVVDRFASMFDEQFGARVTKALVAGAREQDALVARQAWAALLVLMRRLPEWHKWLEKKDVLSQRIFEMLEKGSWGDAKHLGEMLLPLLAHLPREWLTKEFYEAFFNAFFKGLLAKTVLNSKIERQYWISSLAECLRYLSIQENDFVVEVTTFVHRIWLKTVLSTEREGQLRDHLIKHSANSMASLVKYWLKQSQDENREKYDQLIRNFWQNVCSTVLMQIDTISDLNNVPPIVEGHILLLQTLKTGFTTEGKKKHSIKFSGDAPDEKVVKVETTEAVDNITADRYKHYLQEGVERICCNYFSYCDKNDVTDAVLMPLITVLHEFNCENLFVALAKHFNTNGVYELYEKVLMKWMLRDTMRSKAVIDIVFIAIKHMTEEEQDAVLKSFDQLGCGMLEWGLSRALSYEQWGCAGVRRWLRGGTVRGQLLRAARGLGGPAGRGGGPPGRGGGEDLLRVCLSCDDRGVMLISKETASEIAEQVSWSLRQLTRRSAEHLAEVRAQSGDAELAELPELGSAARLAAHLATHLATHLTISLSDSDAHLAPDSTTHVTPDSAAPVAISPATESDKQLATHLATSPAPDLPASPIAGRTTSQTSHLPTPLAPDIRDSLTPDLFATPASDLSTSPAPDISYSGTPDLFATAVSDVTISPAPELSTSPIPDLTASLISEMTTSPIPDRPPSPTPDLTTTPIPDLSESPVSDRATSPDLSPPATCRISDSYMNLLIDLFNIILEIPRGDPRLNINSWLEVRSAVQDAMMSLATADQVLARKKISNILHQRLIKLDEVLVTDIDHMTSLCPYLLNECDDAAPPTDLADIEAFTQQLFDIRNDKTINVKIFALRYDCIMNKLSCPYADNDVIKAVIDEASNNNPVELTKETVVPYLNEFLFRAMCLRTLLLHKVNAEEEDEDEVPKEAKTWCDALLRSDVLQKNLCKVLRDCSVVNTLCEAYQFWLHHNIIKEVKLKSDFLMLSIIKESSQETITAVLATLTAGSASEGYYWAYARSLYASLVETYQGKALPVNVDVSEFKHVLSGNGFFHTLQASPLWSDDSDASLKLKWSVAWRGLHASVESEQSEGRDPPAAVRRAVQVAARAPAFDPLVDIYHAHQPLLLYERDVMSMPWKAAVAEAAVLHAAAEALRLDAWGLPPHQLDFCTLTLCTALGNLRACRHHNTTKMAMLGAATLALFGAAARCAASVRRESVRRTPSPHLSALPQEWTNVFAPSLHADLYCLALDMLESESGEMSCARALLTRRVCAALRAARYEEGAEGARPPARPPARRLARAAARALARPRPPPTHVLAHTVLEAITDAIGDHDVRELAAWSEQLDAAGEAAEAGRAPPALGLRWLHESFSRALQLCTTALAQYTAGVEVCSMEPGSDSHGIALGALLLADIAYRITSQQQGDLSHHYIQIFREDRYTELLLPIALRLLPEHFLLETDLSPPCPRHADYFLTVPDLPADDAGWHWCLPRLACRGVLASVAGAGGAAARGWWGAAGRGGGPLLARLVRLYVAPRLLHRQLQHLAAHKHELPDTEVRVQWASGSCVAELTLEERRVELLISLGAQFPLSLPVVRAPAPRPAVTTNWIAMYLAYQNGTLLNAIKMWIAALSSRVESAPPCYICYCRLEPASGRLPDVPCHQCRNRFHHACLYKWFKSSHRSNCPLCRANF